MKMRPLTRYLVVLLLVGMVAGPGIAQERPARSQGLGEAVGGPRGTTTPSEADSSSLRAGSAPVLTLEQKIAQLFVVTLGGAYRANPNDRDLFRDLPPGGVVIPSVARPSDAAEFIKSLHGLKLDATTGIPLFIATNVYALAQQERLPQQTFMQLPSMLSVVAANDDVLTAGLAKRVAEQLRTMGFNMHLGPSLNLASSLSESEGTVHNFGSDPALVGGAGAVFFSALRAQNILAVATGFPGGAANRADEGPAVLITPPQHLESRELLPYARAVQQGIDVVHVANTIVPTLDKSLRPANQSPLVLEGLLRFKVGFKGLAMAGPVDSPDFAGRQTPGEAAVASLRAGVDLIYMQSSGRAAAKAIQTVAEAVANGTLQESQIERAFDRVVTVKRAHGLAERPEPDVDAAEAIEKQKHNYDETYKIERQAITLVQNQGNILPLTKSGSMPIGVTGVLGVEDLHDELEEYIKKITHQRITTARHIRRLQEFEIERLTRNVAGMKTAVVVLTNDLPHQGQARLITGLQEKGVRVVVVLLGYPTDLAHFRHADAIVCAYTSGLNVGETMRAVADILVGNAPIRVLPAVRDIRRYVGQPIPFDVKDVVQTPVGRLPASVGAGFEAGVGLSYPLGDKVKRVEWDFGDGKRSKRMQDSHTYSAPGRYTATLTVTDGQGIVSTGSFGIVIEDVASD